MVTRTALLANPLAIDEIQNEILGLAVQTCNEFLDHCRTVALSPFVHGIPTRFDPKNKKRVVYSPYTMSWFDSKGTQWPILSGDVNAMASSGAVLSPESGEVLFDSIADSMKSGSDPDLVDGMLVDAEEHLQVGRLREAVISLAVACEVASNDFVRRSGRSTDPEVRVILRASDSFARKRLAKLTQEICGRSFENEDPGRYSTIEELYRSRNSIAHEGKPAYLDNGVERPITDNRCDQYLEAARVVSRWLKSL